MAVIALTGMVGLLTGWRTYELGRVDRKWKRVRLNRLRIWKDEVHQQLDELKGGNLIGKIYEYEKHFVHVSTFLSRNPWCSHNTLGYPVCRSGRKRNIDCETTRIRYFAQEKQVLYFRSLFSY